MWKTDVLKTWPCLFIKRPVGHQFTCSLFDAFPPFTCFRRVMGHKLKVKLFADHSRHGYVELFTAISIIVPTLLFHHHRYPPHCENLLHVLLSATAWCHLSRQLWENSSFDSYICRDLTHIFDYCLIITVLWYIAFWLDIFNGHRENRQIFQKGYRAFLTCSFDAFIHFFPLYNRKKAIC